MTSEPNYAALLARFPTELPPGPCAFCGGEFACHRIIDALRGEHAAGMSVEEIIADRPHESPELIRAILEGEE
jgi:hypothetical protein